MNQLPSINLGPWINVGHQKFYSFLHQLGHFGHLFFFKIFRNFIRAFDKAIGPEKSPKLIKVGPTFILNYSVPTHLNPQPKDVKYILSHV